MKEFLRYDSTGRVVSVGVCQDSCFHLQRGYPDELLEFSGVFVGLDTHYVENGALVTMPPRPTQHHVFNYAAKTWELDSAGAWQEVRQRRNTMLAASDWTQLPDVPLETKSAWTAYRQALRDVTSQADPLNIEWPQVPW